MNSYCYGGANSTTLESAVKPVIGGGGGSDLPDITEMDEGKYLKVVDQKPQWMPSEGPISTTISHIEAIDRADYDALEVKDPNTLYLIKG